MLIMHVIHQLHYAIQCIVSNISLAFWDFIFLYIRRQQQAATGVIFSARPSVVRLFVCRPSSVHPMSVNFARCDSSTLIGAISVKLSILYYTFIIRVGIAEKVFKGRGQKSRSHRYQMYFLLRRHTFRRSGVEAKLFLFLPVFTLMFPHARRLYL